jgi:hypothetical protein
MQHELEVSFDDIKEILASLIASPYKVEVTLSSDESIEHCSVKNLEEDIDLVILESGGRSYSTPITSIVSMEFDFFYKYHGLSSKRFIVS